ncbi:MULTISPECIES: hypothetical protein [Methylobacterium]|uniref:Uncharacterized protein n=1 Tax=Methylobacterium phyllosphaerae TaxID=418223 RepID=A0AAE8L4Z1_9HYPH|nr:MULTISPECIES: hypothetical protein [Methylobacterium]APT30895.1 hypothetical protein MCBMB27_01604 [Methylobacterium phyllosphaerae]RUP16527.1 MAG: hypothetical protein EKK43_01630 [Methylobacterium sp.]SFG35035.1 hypothetical protein SAMN05192567_102226 [Methylobacterium phyllosphaerae]SFV01748.1 hypothetical protein SAMN02799643_03990 [Methylobacterium sp. UNCCL125]
MLLNRAVVAALIVAVAAFLLYLAALARAALSPNEPYAASIGLTLDQCVAAQDGLSAEAARLYCRRPVPKRL